MFFFLHKYIIQCVIFVLNYTQLFFALLRISDMTQSWLSIAVADLEGAQQTCAPPPPKFGWAVFFCMKFCIRMLKNKAWIARESIKTPRAGPGPRPCLHTLFLWYVFVHIIFCIPPPPPQTNQNLPLYSIHPSNGNGVKCYSVF